MKFPCYCNECGARIDCLEEIGLWRKSYEPRSIVAGCKEKEYIPVVTILCCGCREGQDQFIQEQIEHGDFDADIAFEEAIKK